MRHCRSCWQWDESVYQQEQYLLHLAWAPLHPGRFLLKGEIPVTMTPTSKRGSLPDLLISAFLKAPLTSLEAVTKQELQNTVFPGLAELTTQHMWWGAPKIALCCLTSLSSNLKSLLPSGTTWRSFKMFGLILKVL